MIISGNVKRDIEIEPNALGTYLASSCRTEDVAECLNAYFSVAGNGEDLHQVASVIHDKLSVKAKNAMALSACSSIRKNKDRVYSSIKFKDLQRRCVHCECIELKEDPVEGFLYNCKDKRNSACFCKSTTCPGVLRVTSSGIKFRVGDTVNFWVDANRGRLYLQGVVVSVKDDEVECCSMVELRVGKNSYKHVPASRITDVCRD